MVVPFLLYEFRYQYGVSSFDIVVFYRYIIYN